MRKKGASSVISHTSRLTVHVSALAVIFALAGCSSTPDGPGSGSSSSSSSGSGSGSGSGSSAAVSYAKDLVPIFQLNCSAGGTACHGDPSVTTIGIGGGGNRAYQGPATGTPGMAVSAMVLGGMVGKPSFEAPSLDVIKAGDAANSWLFIKMEGTQANFAAKCTGDLATSPPPCGLGMPYGIAPLPAAQLDKVKSWINAGAPNN
jgi:hypothetical protein